MWKKAKRKTSAGNGWQADTDLPSELPASPIGALACRKISKTKRRQIKGDRICGSCIDRNCYSNSYLDKFSIYGLL